MFDYLEAIAEGVCDNVRGQPHDMAGSMAERLLEYPFWPDELQGLTEDVIVDMFFEWLAEDGYLPVPDGWAVR